MFKRIKIVADRNVPFLEGIFEPYADIVFIDGKDITAQDVKYADAMIIRTRTRCNRELLEGSRVSIIATATIGTDHIDLEYCKENGIRVYNAQGCNAGGVMQYVFSALYGTASRNAIKLDGATIGIIGVGNVGKKIEHMARYLGFNVLLCDPPRAAKEGQDGFCTLEHLLTHSNVVTMHTPLDETTKRMADAGFFSLMRPGTFFINASRGEVVDEDALMEAIPKLGPVIIDTWNNEPDINEQLIDMVEIATPHIAGYSFQGKQNGTAAAVRAIARFFGIMGLYHFFPACDLPEHQPIKLDLRGKNQGEITALFQYNYPIFTDDFLFRMDPRNFEKMRSEYKYRREIYVE
ncbi:MAG: 4-phosphoerythronate dehydrogenase [Bacteroidales bacterium]|nr:4-phosphoerythronate dehydrogenase [Bacteroidales bacterium]MDE7128570.1 4-phosphoerythronate dehydrogenase [Bacteroidales bacterium]